MNEQQSGYIVTFDLLEKRCRLKFTSLAQADHHMYNMISNASRHIKVISLDRLDGQEIWCCKKSIVFQKWRLMTEQFKKLVPHTV